MQLLHLNCHILWKSKVVPFHIVNNYFYFWHISVVFAVCLEILKNCSSVRLICINQDFDRVSI